MVARIELFEQALILTPSFYHAITFDFACLPTPLLTSQPTMQLFCNCILQGAIDFAACS